jgi:hypothetical protein
MSSSQHYTSKLKSQQTQHTSQHTSQQIQHTSQHTSHASQHTSQQTSQQTLSHPIDKSLFLACRSGDAHAGFSVRDLLFPP